MRSPEMIGKVFGRYTVVRVAETSIDKHKSYVCKCACGNERIVVGTTLRIGTSRSCGCLSAELAKGRNNNIKHGNTKNGSSPSRTYISWKSMRTRCYSPKHDAYSKYGAKGITVCERWNKSFEDFLSDMGERPAGMTLDRINTLGNYEPGNCRWATWQQQASNRRKAAIPLTTITAWEFRSLIHKRSGPARQQPRWMHKVRRPRNPNAAKYIKAAP